MRELLESTLLLTIGYGRLLKAWITGGDATRARILLAEDLDDCGAHRLACRRLDRIIAAHPTLPRAFLARAMALLGLERPRDALQDFDRALALDPEFPGARQWRARTLSKLGEHAAAAADYLHDLRARPDGPHGPVMGVSPLQWTDCAQAFAASGDTGQAIRLLEEYFAGHAARVTAYRRDETAPMRLLARLYTQSGETGRAASLRQLAMQSPNRVPADERD
jgi:tetratricopeptide (TPR) repeat protein